MVCFKRAIIHDLSRYRVWEILLKIPGNDACCDCGSPNPRWASINLGITLCIGESMPSVTLIVNDTQEQLINFCIFHAQSVPVYTEVSAFTTVKYVL